MERLTNEIDNGQNWLKECRDPEYQCHMDCGDCEAMHKAFDRLTEYEDTGLTPQQIKTADDFLKENYQLRVDALKDAYELLELKAADRLLVLPCAIGTPVFVHEQLCSQGRQLTYTGCKYSQDCMRDRFIKCPLRVVKRAFTVNMHKGLGITFWLTKKEAEDAIPADRRSKA